MSNNKIIIGRYINGEKYDYSFSADQNDMHFGQIKTINGQSIVDVTQRDGIRYAKNLKLFDLDPSTNKFYIYKEGKRYDYTLSPQGSIGPPGEQKYTIACPLVETEDKIWKIPTEFIPENLIAVDDALDETSQNPVQNKIITKSINEINNALPETTIVDSGSYDDYFMDINS